MAHKEKLLRNLNLCMNLKSNKKKKKQQFWKQIFMNKNKNMINRQIKFSKNLNRIKDKCKEVLLLKLIT